jgi:hypothetical protein
MNSLEKICDNIDFGGSYQIGKYQIKKSTVYLIALGGIAALALAPPVKGF